MFSYFWNWLWNYKEVNCAGCGKKILCKNNYNIPVCCSNSCMFNYVNKK